MPTLHLNKFTHFLPIFLIIIFIRYSKLNFFTFSYPNFTLTNISMTTESSRFNHL